MTIGDEPLIVTVLPQVLLLRLDEGVVLSVFFHGLLLLLSDGLSVVFLLFGLGGGERGLLYDIYLRLLLKYSLLLPVNLAKYAVELLLGRTVVAREAPRGYAVNL